MKINSFRIALGGLLVAFLAVFVTNFPFTTYLTGWDNLHPEFNFLLNISRGFNAVWQENQGVGTYGGHGYAATLPHSIMLFITSFIIPNMYLRSTFTFACLLLGVLGVFFLSRKLLSKYEPYIGNFGALFAGLYYLLNFGTVQNFYIQLESFIVQYAFLPWLFLTLIQFLEKRTIKRFIIFSVVSFFATIQGFIPPLFFVYMLLLGVFLAVYIAGGDYIKRIKLSVLVVAATLVINSYWLFPVAYYSLTRTSTYLNAYNNLSSTGDFILKNEKYGDLKNLVVLKGFVSEAIDSSTGGNVFYIFSQWLTHLSRPEVTITGYLLFVLILIGVITLIRNKNIPYRFGFLVCFVLAFSLLATNTLPFAYVSKAFQEIPILRQAFRVAFTKFSLSVAFFYALSFGIGVAALLSIINSRVKKFKKAAIGAVVVLIALALVYFSLPVFTGNFIYQRARIQIPSIYKDLFTFFDHEPVNSRIANLPQGWNWGWTIYNWGYSGSGFLWYGIKQPIMDRAFDVWGLNNENYYWELSHAIYAEDYKSIDVIFNKYNVDWVIVDKNVIPYLNARGALYTNRLDTYLASSPNYTLVKTLKPKEEGLQNITIYKVNSRNQKDFQAFYLTPLKNIGPAYTYAQLDPGFKDYGTYYSDPSQAYDIYYPFRSLFSNEAITTKTIDALPIQIVTDKKYITATTTLPTGVGKYTLVLPTIAAQYEGITPTSLVRENNKIVARVEKNTDPNYSYNNKNDPNFLHHKASNCSANDLTASKAFSQTIVDTDILRFNSKASENCYNIILPQLFQRYGYFIEIDSKHIAGKPLQFAVINNDSRKTEIEYSLPTSASFQKSYIFIPPMKYYGSGYSLVFNNISIGNIPTVNELKTVTINPFPYEVLTGIRLMAPQGSVSHNSLFEFTEAFDPGWNAYEVKSTKGLSGMFPFWFGQKLHNHVLVNNWANGWEVPQADNKSHNSIVVVFLPQYLEYAGFLLLGGYVVVLGVILLRKRIKRAN